MPALRSLIAIPLAAALLVPVPARGEDPPPLDPSPWLGEAWYGIYMASTKMGFARMSGAREEREGGAVVVMESAVTMRMKSMGEKSEIRITERTVYAATGTQGWLESHRTQSVGDRIAMEVRGTRVKDGVEIVTRKGAEETGRRTVPAPALTLRDTLAPNLMIAEGAPEGTRRKMRSFDIEEGRESEDDVEITAIEDGFTDGVKTRVFVIRITDGDTGDSYSGRATSAGCLIEIEFGGAFRLRLEPEALAKDIQYSADLFVKGLLRPDRKLGDPTKVSALTLRLRGADESLRLPSDGRQTVTREEDGALLLVIRADVARDALPAASDEDIARHLRPTADYPSDHAEIRALARQAVGDATSAEERVRRLVSFVDRYVEDATTASSDTALDVLRGRKGDCTEHATLFIALCRAVDIPARDADGLMYCGDELRAFGGHAWAEVVLDGRWVAADPTWNEFPVDATHITQASGGGAENTFRLLVSKAKVEVVSVETRR